MVLSTSRIFAVLVTSATVPHHLFWLILFRIETVVALVIIGIILLYTRWLTQHYRPLMQGQNLEPYALVNRNKCCPPRLVEFGLTDIPKYPGGHWHWKHKNWAFFASRGCRPYMEDRMHYLNDPRHNLVFFSIFDGHGGPFVSQYLQEHFSEAIRRRLLRGGSEHRASLTGHPNNYVIEAIVTEVHSIDDEISRLHPSLTSLTGSTLISIILERNRFLTVINVGDSRAVACDLTGRAVPLSADHKPSDEHERKRIESAGGFVEFRGVDRVQGILSVSRAFGDTELKRLCVLTAQPDIVRVDLNEINLQFILVASDGFWDVLSNEQAVHLAQTFLRASSNQWHKMVAQSLCLMLTSEHVDLEYIANSVYLPKIATNGTTDAGRVSLVNRITYAYITPVIISFGIIGDIMTVATLTHPLLRRSTIIYTYLTLLAVTDLSTLISVIPMILWLLDCRLCSYQSAFYYAHIGFPLVNAFMGASVWIVVFLTMSQYMAVCHPFHYCYLRTRKMCFLLVIIAYIMNFCIYAPWAAKKAVYEVLPGMASCEFVVCDRKLETWYKGYEWCRETISRLLPFVLVAYFNSKILITYRSTKKDRFQRLASNKQKMSIRSEQEEKRLFTLLFSIIIIFFVCTIPAAPLTIFVSDKQSLNLPFQIIRAIINVMEFTKFALNFYFYCLINPDIRQACFHMIRCKTINRPARISGQPVNPISQLTKTSRSSSVPGDNKRSNGCSKLSKTSIAYNSVKDGGGAGGAYNPLTPITENDDRISDSLIGNTYCDPDIPGAATTTTTVNDILINADSVEEIRLLIDDHASMV